MLTLPLPATDLTVMGKRLPRPTDGINWGVLVSQAEARAIEDLAHGQRLSVASFLRVLVADAIKHPERAKAWETVATELAAGTPEDPPKKPGRPPGAKKKA